MNAFEVRIVLCVLRPSHVEEERHGEEALGCLL
jgi:hypothetical protein